MSSNTIYCRLSSTNQSNFNGKYISIENQQDNAIEYCNNNNIKYDNIISEIVSAKYIKNQKKLNNFLENNSNCNLIFYNTTRFSRNVKDALDFVDKCISKNISLHFVEEGICYTNHLDRHRLIMALSNSEYESRTISHRITTNNKILKRKGWQFGQPEYGKISKIDNDGIRKFKKNNYEEDVIKFIVMARQGKVKCTELNKQLNKLNPDDKSPIEFIHLETGNKIEKFDKLYMLTYNEIAELLNSYNIKKRNKEWTTNMISKVYYEAINCTKSLKNINI